MIIGKPIEITIVFNNSSIILLLFVTERDFEFLQRIIQTHTNTINNFKLLILIIHRYLPLHYSVDPIEISNLVDPDFAKYCSSHRPVSLIAAHNPARLMVCHPQERIELSSFFFHVLFLVDFSCLSFPLVQQTLECLKPQCVYLTLNRRISDLFRNSVKHNTANTI